MTTANSLDQILGQIEQVRARRPELRLGQLMAIVGTLAEDETGHSLWDVDDADFLAALERFVADATHSESSNVEHGGIPDCGMSSTPEPEVAEPPRQVN